MILPTAPVRSTGPRTMAVLLARKCSITFSMGTSVIKQRSAEPGVGSFALAVRSSVLAGAD